MSETSNPLQRPPLRHSAGFTLIEIMAVIVIIGMLSGLVGVSIINQINKSRVVAAKAQISNLEAVLELYQMDNADYPTTEDGLSCLVKECPGARDFPVRGYLQKKRVPSDPWDNPYQYQHPGQNNPHFYDLCSLGKDGKIGGEGIDADVCNWEDGGMEN